VVHVAAPVRVLIEDPDLGEGLSGARLREAERTCLARVVRVPRGPWPEGPGWRGVDGGFGLLVLRGLLSRRVGRGGRFGAELLGPGDLLRPWDDPLGQAAVPFTADWRIIQPVRLAILDRRFALSAAPYPEIVVQLIRRTLLRSRRLAATMAIVHAPKVEARVHTLLWTLAERWGKVRPDGVALSLPLTHTLLADMVAASRPAVSAAASALTKRGHLRRNRNLWLLRGGPPPDSNDVGRATSS
jgi:CRP/FNR family cyclic AMP-dependent transcriptional regulator